MAILHLSELFKVMISTLKDVIHGTLIFNHRVANVFMTIA
jgi:hypothetical protein